MLPSKEQSLNSLQCGLCPFGFKLMFPRVNHKGIAASSCLDTPKQSQPTSYTDTQRTVPQWGAWPPLSQGRRWIPGSRANLLDHFHTPSTQNLGEEVLHVQ